MSYINQKQLLDRRKSFGLTIKEVKAIQPDKVEHIYRHAKNGGQGGYRTKEYLYDVDRIYRDHFKQNANWHQIESKESMMQDVIGRFKEKIYTSVGDINLRTVKAIAIAAGLKSPSIYKDPMGWLQINCEIIDPYGNAIDEVRSIYEFCLWLKSRE